MKNTTRFGLAISLVAATFGTACGSDGGGGNSDDGGSGGTGGAAASGGIGGSGAIGGTGATGGIGGSGATGGTTSDGNDTKETASEISIGTDPASDSIQGQLDPPESDLDWYKFEGTAGQVIQIIASAKPSTDPFAITFPDVVVTLFDANGTQLAEQDDPTPSNSNDPYLLTVLPSAGTYYLRVLECNVWDKGGAANCSDPAAITNPNYTLYVGELAFTTPGEVKEAEPNNDAATASSITFAPVANQTGHFYLTALHGTFESETDIDVYSLTVPANLAIDAGSRAVVSFNPQPGGTDGNGSSTMPGEVYLTTKADPATIIAQVDVSLGANLGVPVTVGTDYLVFEKRVAAPSGAHDFYFDLPGVATGNPVEQSESANDLAATAEALTESTGSYYIEGNLTSITDTDHFSVIVPPSEADTISVACTAQRSGSGLRGFTMAVLNGDGSAVSGATQTETANDDALIDAVATPSGQTKLIVKLTATSQDAAVSSTFYRCGIHFNPTPTN